MEVDSPSRSVRAQGAARKAETEANKRIEEARKRVRDAEIEAQQQLEVQRDQYEKRSEMERARQGAALERQKFEGYERVRETQRTYDQQQNSVQHQGEKQLSEIENQFKTTTQKAEIEGEKTLKKTVAENYQQQEALRRQNKEQLDNFSNDYQQQKAALQFDRDNGVAMLMKQTNEERQRLEAQSRDAIAVSKDHYEGNYVTTMKNQRDTLAELTRQANQELAERRLSSAHRLDAYSTRQSDPFYKLVNLNAELSETDDAFILTARIPEHEQERVQVNVRGNELVISGQRRNEERLESAPGRVQTTSSYQSFSETLPIHWPVEPKGMSREFNGDALTVRIPKKTTYGADHFKSKRTATRATVEQPQFPKNLPGEKELNQQLNQSREQSEQVARAESVRKTRSGRTLA